MKRDRRNVLKKGISIAGASIVIPLFPGCETDKVKSSNKGVEYNISTETALSSPGGAVMKTFGENNSGNPVIIIRSTQTQFVVLTSVCTHQGCTVNLPTASGIIVCGCHNSRYSSLNGNVIQGPATSPLRQFENSYNSMTNILTIYF